MIIISLKTHWNMIDLVLYAKVKCIKKSCFRHLGKTKQKNLPI